MSQRSAIEARILDLYKGAKVVELKPGSCPLCHGSLTVPALVLTKHLDGRWTETVERRPCGKCQKQTEEADARQPT